MAREGLRHLDFILRAEGKRPGSQLERVIPKQQPRRWTRGTGGRLQMVSRFHPFTFLSGATGLKGVGMASKYVNVDMSAIPAKNRTEQNRTSSLHLKLKLGLRLLSQVHRQKVHSSGLTASSLVK